MDSSGFAPQSMWSVLLLPLLLTFFAVMVRVSAVQFERNYGRKTNSRKVYLAVSGVLLAIAFYMGCRWMWNLWNPDALSREIYIASGMTGKVRIAHYLAFFLPLITGVVMFLVESRNAKRSRLTG